MSDKSTKSIQNQLLRALIQFDKTCQDAGVHYSLHGGTLLGAIRERKFIEWDDDADVTLTREYFNKLKKYLHSARLPDGFFFDETNSQKPMFWFVEKNAPAVWIDIFVYDFISQNKFAQRLKILGSTFFLAITKNKEAMEVFKGGEYNLGLVGTTVKITHALFSVFPISYKLRLMDAFGEHLFCGNKTLVYRSNDQYKGMKKIIPYSLCLDYDRIDFCGIELEVFKNSSDVLISCYGKDYMVPKKDSEICFKAHQKVRKTKSL